MAEESSKKTEAKAEGGRTGNAGRKLGTRKVLPSVSYLLAHGDPETAHLPKSWMEVAGFPLALALVFFLSLLTFHYAPHGLSKHEGFKLPQRHPHQHQQRQPEQILKDDADPVENPEF